MFVNTGFNCHPVKVSGGIILIPYENQQTNK